jgi:type VI secretion system protein VasJ
MLARLIGGRRWHWTAVGKHPSAKDYIRVGATSPLLEAVAQWSDSGYRALNIGKTDQTVYHSWRFWLKGLKKGTLVCGLGRDSSDSIGRPYPLVIMGEGTLAGWEKQWSMLPVRLEATWNRMEFVASHRFEDALAMEAEVKQLKGPDANAGLVKKPAPALEGPGLDLDTCRQALAKDGIGMMTLNQTDSAQSEQLMQYCHRIMEGCCTEIPRGVFMGGTPRQTYLTIIQHPLGVEDFVRLWSC